jgi:hypothetical protein
MNKSEQSPLFLSLFFTSASLLSYEIFLTRIISAMFLKYFSLLAISVAMAGLGMAGVVVQLYLSDKSAGRRVRYRILSALLLSASLILIPLLYSYIRIPSLVVQVSDLFRLAVFIGLCIMPFFWGGLILALAYHYNTNLVQRIYFLDLLGAGSGCLLAFWLLNQTDGFSAVLFSAVVGQAALLAVSLELEPGKRALAWGLSLLVAGLFVFNHLSGAWRLPHPSGRKNVNEFEQWSEFGLTTVARRSHFRGIGISRRFEPVSARVFKVITQDYNSSTHVVNAGADQAELEKVKRQIGCFPLLFKESPRVLVLGAGGGKEVFAALLCGSRKVTAVEFNRTIVNDIMLNWLYDFSGRLYERPEVEVIVDEARNYLTRSRRKFDVILPVTGTTPRLLAAGCYGFSTEYLQTKEAYRAYLEHLTPNGVFGITFSFDSDTADTRFQPHYRLLATIKETLLDTGRNPKEHIMIAGGKIHSSLANFDYSIAVIFSPEPFSRADAERAARVADRMGFELIFSPYHQAPGLLSRFLLAESNELFYRRSPINIRPVSDDNPYYYNHLKPEDWLDWDKMPHYFRFLASVVLIFVVYLLSLVILPLVLSRKQRRHPSRVYIRHLVYFACLGLGFICLELTIMQRVNVFIGIPTYGFLATVLAFTLFMGLGGLTAGRLPEGRIKRWMLLLILMLAGILLLYRWAWPRIISGLAHWPAIHKIALCVVMLCPVGLIVGMPFVLGIRLLDKNAAKAVAWMWAVNATTSTMGSVMVSLSWLLWGYTKTTTLGWGLYLLAALIL